MRHQLTTETFCEDDRSRKWFRWCHAPVVCQSGPLDKPSLGPPTNPDERTSQLKKRLEHLQEQAEDEIRQRQKEARAVVTDLELQLSEITGRPSATMIKAASFDDHRAPRTNRPHITDEKLEIRFLSLLHEEGKQGMNAKTIAEKLDQAPVRIRQWVNNHPTVLRRVGSGHGTRFYVQ